MKRTLFPLLSLCLVVGLTGCAGVKNSMRLSEKDSAWNPIHKLSQERKKDKKEESVPVTMAAIWKDSVMENPTSASMKGFGGRLYFYDQDNNAVKADGELIVYGFDDSVKGKDDSKRKADVKFVFKQDEFQSHFSESGLGASYSVWLPFEAVGGFRKSVTLIPMFKTADGRLLKSGQSINVLPGKTPDQLQVSQSKDLPYTVLGSSPAVIRQANYQSGDALPSSTSTVGVANASYQDTAGVRREPTEIRMTPSMAQRMAMARSAVRQSQAKPDVTADLDPASLNRVFVSPKKVRDSEKAELESNYFTPTQESKAARRPFGQPGSFQ